MQGAFNKNPPIPAAKPNTWDVNVLLDYFTKLEDNDSLSCNDLAGKMISLLLLAKMCRISEIMSLKRSKMSIVRGGIEFILDKPTKTYSHRNYKDQAGLQHFNIPTFAGNKKICPVTAVLDYLKRTSLFRNEVDHVVICQFQGGSTPRKAARGTITRWVKKHMVQAGLGEFQVKSHRHSSSMTAALSGCNLDFLIAQVGWVSPSMFVKHYMRPMATKTVLSQGDKSKSALPDRHKFTSLWSKNTPRSRIRHNIKLNKATKFIQSQSDVVTQSCNPPPQPYANRNYTASHPTEEDLACLTEQENDTIPTESQLIEVIVDNSEDSLGYQDLFDRVNAPPATPAIPNHLPEPVLANSEQDVILHEFPLTLNSDDMSSLLSICGNNMDEQCEIHQPDSDPYRHTVVQSAKHTEPNHSASDTDPQHIEQVVDKIIQQDKDEHFKLARTHFPRLVGDRVGNVSITPPKRKPPCSETTRVSLLEKISKLNERKTSTNTAFNSIMTSKPTSHEIKNALRTKILASNPNTAKPAADNSKNLPKNSKRVTFCTTTSPNPNPRLLLKQRIQAKHSTSSPLPEDLESNLEVTIVPRAKPQ